MQDFVPRRFSAAAQMDARRPSRSFDKGPQASYQASSVVRIPKEMSPNDKK